MENSRVAKVLVIEKCPTARQFICDCLIRLGCDVVQAEDGWLGRKFLLTQPLPDLILLDLDASPELGRLLLAVRECCQELLFIPVVAMIHENLEKITSPNTSSVFKPLDRKILHELVRPFQRDSSIDTLSFQLSKTELLNDG